MALRGFLAKELLQLPWRQMCQSWYLDLCRNTLTNIWLSPPDDRCIATAHILPGALVTSHTKCSTQLQRHMEKFNNAHQCVILLLQFLGVTFLRFKYIKGQSNPSILWSYLANSKKYRPNHLLCDIKPGKKCVWKFVTLCLWKDVEHGWMVLRVVVGEIGESNRV